jgi:hypothetical protein
MLKRGVRSVKAYINSNPIQFMGTSLEFQNSLKSLGMVLDERLTWTTHTTDIVKRANFRLKHLSTFRCVLNEDVRKMLMEVKPVFLIDFADEMSFDKSYCSDTDTTKISDKCKKK